ncbi:MAG: UbiX family flavin prenyltransferase [Bacteroidales bacterium]|nr:UbiX family flavin prenyltransferase [Bacteroidales bacterium]MCB9000209.1 UbiX family flavin prenyltransferase [Bacteroidales bacterium]MCB9013712.1 UbiX family flavin prenyltransferase [Bacteroidales bacterium]
MEKKKIILAVTGASGSVYARLLMREIAKLENQVDRAGIIFSGTAQKVWEHELQSPPQIPAVFTQFSPDDFFSPPASGSAGFDTMIICPCSMGTLGRIANGISDDLITRSADVMLKEKRTLILVPRESPYSLIHLKNMERLILAGAEILPASPSFYSHPADMESLLMSVIERILLHAGFHTDHYEWGEKS